MTKLNKTEKQVVINGLVTAIYGAVKDDCYITAQNILNAVTKLGLSSGVVTMTQNHIDLCLKIKDAELLEKSLSM